LNRKTAKEENGKKKAQEEMKKEEVKKKQEEAAKARHAEERKKRDAEEEAEKKKQAEESEKKKQAVEAEKKKQTPTEEASKKESTKGGKDSKINNVGLGLFADLAFGRTLFTSFSGSDPDDKDKSVQKNLQENFERLMGGPFKKVMCRVTQDALLQSKVLPAAEGAAFQKALEADPAISCQAHFVYAGEKKEVPPPNDKGVAAKEENKNTEKTENTKGGQGSSGATEQQTQIQEDDAARVRMARETPTVTSPDDLLLDALSTKKTSSLAAVSRLELLSTELTTAGKPSEGPDSMSDLQRRLAELKQKALVEQATGGGAGEEKISGGTGTTISSSEKTQKEDTFTLKDPLTPKKATETLSEKTAAAPLEKNIIGPSFPDLAESGGKIVESATTGVARLENKKTPPSDNLAQQQQKETSASSKDNKNTKSQKEEEGETLQYYKCEIRVFLSQVPNAQKLVEAMEASEQSGRALLTNALAAELRPEFPKIHLTLRNHSLKWREAKLVNEIPSAKDLKEDSKKAAAVLAEIIGKDAALKSANSKLEKAEEAKKKENAHEEASKKKNAEEEALKKKNQKKDPVEERPRGGYWTEGVCAEQAKVAQSPLKTDPLSSDHRFKGKLLADLLADEDKNISEKKDFSDKLFDAVFDECLAACEDARAKDRAYQSVVVKRRKALLKDPHAAHCFCHACAGATQGLVAVYKNKDPENDLYLTWNHESTGNSDRSSSKENNFFSITSSKTAEKDFKSRAAMDDAGFSFAGFSKGALQGPLEERTVENGKWWDQANYAKLKTDCGDTPYATFFGSGWGKISFRMSGQGTATVEWRQCFLYGGKDSSKNVSSDSSSKDLEKVKGHTLEVAVNGQKKAGVEVGSAEEGKWQKTKFKFQNADLLELVQRGYVAAQMRALTVE